MTTADEEQQSKTVNVATRPNAELTGSTNEVLEVAFQMDAPVIRLARSNPFTRTLRNTAEQPYNSGDERVISTTTKIKRPSASKISNRPATLFTEARADLFSTLNVNLAYIGDSKWVGAAEAWTEIENQLVVKEQKLRDVYAMWTAEIDYVTSTARAWADWEREFFTGTHTMNPEMKAVSDQIHGQTNAFELALTLVVQTLDEDNYTISTDAPTAGDLIALYRAAPDFMKVGFFTAGHLLRMAPSIEAAINAIENDEFDPQSSTNGVTEDERNAYFEFFNETPLGLVIQDAAEENKNNANRCQLSRVISSVLSDMKRVHNEAKDLGISVALGSAYWARELSLLDHKGGTAREMTALYHAYWCAVESATGTYPKLRDYEDARGRLASTTAVELMDLLRPLYGKATEILDKHRALAPYSLSHRVQDFAENFDDLERQNDSLRASWVAEDCLKMIEFGIHAQTMLRYNTIENFVDINCSIALPELAPFAGTIFSIETEFRHGRDVEKFEPTTITLVPPTVDTSQLVVGSVQSKKQAHVDKLQHESFVTQLTHAATLLGRVRSVTDPANESPRFFAATVEHIRAFAESVKIGGGNPFKSAAIDEVGKAMGEIAENYDVDTLRDDEDFRKAVFDATTELYDRTLKLLGGNFVPSDTDSLVKQADKAAAARANAADAASESGTVAPDGVEVDSADFD